MIEMIKLDDNHYIPKECCTVTNPSTSNGKSEIDSIDIPCGADCYQDCSKCIIQKVMDEYAKLTNQVVL